MQDGNETKKFLSLYPCTEAAGMQEAITEGLRVRVSTLFLPDRSFRYRNSLELFYTYRSDQIIKAVLKFKILYKMLFRRSLSIACVLSRQVEHPVLRTWLSQH